MNGKASKRREYFINDTVLSNTSFIIRAVSLVEKKEILRFYFVSYSGEAQSIEKSICYETSEQIWDGKWDSEEIILLT